MNRKVLCPACNAVNDYPILTFKPVYLEDKGLVCSIVPVSESITCFFCEEKLDLALNDFQNVEFVESNDGYHSWYSQPTSIHTIWRCKNRPILCKSCSHNKENDMFCRNGRIDVRTPLS